MKKVFCLLLIALITCFTALPCFAMQGEYLRDDADLLTDQEEISIKTELAYLSEEFGCNKSALAYAHEQYDAIYGGESYDGILLVINMDPSDREWAISFNGKYASYEDYDLMSNSVIYLQTGYYHIALLNFDAACQDMFTAQRDNSEFDSSAGLLGGIANCLLIGFIIALIVVLIMKGQLKSVRSKAGANDYVVKDSFSLTRSNDIYLYSTVTKSPIPRNTSGSGARMGGTGGSRGGASGRF